MFTATRGAPAIDPHEHLGRDVLSVDGANPARDIPHHPPAMTVVKLSEQRRRLDGPPNQLNIIRCRAHIMYVGIRAEKVRASNEPHLPSPSPASMLTDHGDKYILEPISALESRNRQLPAPAPMQVRAGLRQQTCLSPIARLSAERRTVAKTIARFISPER